MKDKREGSSLSARERKALRRGEVQPKAPDRDRVRYHMVLAVLAGIVALALIAAGIIIPVYYNANYLGYERPIAVFEIQAGNETTVLEYEIYEEEYPIVSANFLFLASEGFFDGVIIYDNSSQWVKFGGYTGLDYTHKSDSPDMINKVKRHFTDEKTSAKTSFRYKLKADSPSESPLNISERNYLLTGIAGSTYGSSTEFQFSCSKSNKNPSVSENGYVRNFSSEAFAAPLESSVSKCEALFTHICGIGTTNKSTSDFATPLENDNPIVIKSVRVYNYEDKWNSVSYKNGFTSYMEELNAFSSSTWDRQYVKPHIKEEED